MSRKSFRLVVVSSLFCLALATSVAAQDFQKSYRIGAGGRIDVGTVSGNVQVTAYNGDAVIVSGFKQGRDRDMVEIEDHSSGNDVDVHVRYPKHCDCDASVKFEVQVPAGVNYDFDGISSVSGDVHVSGVTGKLRSSSVSGNVEIKDVSGSVNATSVSGDVSVEISRFEGNDDMKFSSVSGDVDIRLPANLDADIDMSSFSGSIKTDFPIEVRSEKYTTRQHAHGRVGNGSRSLNMSSVSGSLSLRYL